jgi:predicted AAA+ superfamily ATPase
MVKRSLEKIAFSKEFGRQMRFITGARQTGKTTLAKEIISANNGYYYNWDSQTTRSKYLKNPYFFHDEILASSTPRTKKWICFDEIHKASKWKDILKDYFDTFEDRYKFIITGSARLDFLKKSGDSLAGRYFNFHLNTIALNEIVQSKKVILDFDNGLEFILNQISKPVYRDNELEMLIKFSGFPEPLTNGTKNFHNIWQRTYIERLVKDDMRDLSKSENLDQVQTLVKLLPERIGSLLSVNSLANNMLIGYKAVKTLLRSLELMLVIFKIKPWHKKIGRAIQKEPKIYFYDWTHIKNESALFENLVALELKNRIDLWTDSGFGIFELFFIRTKEGREIDFLITKDGTPWLLAEVKTSAENIASHNYKISEQLGGIPFVQIVKESGITQEREKRFFQVSASRFFSV